MPCRLLALFMLFFVLGCNARAPQPLPAYSWTGAENAIKDLCKRSHAVRTVSAESTLTLTRPDGQSVRLDGAIVMRLPDSVRIRAWKFGQAALDLTMTPRGVWIESGDNDPSHREQILPAGANAAKMARAWSILSGTFFCAPNLSIYDRGADRFCIEGIIDGQRVLCDIDRATLTPRRYTIVDPNGAQRFRLSIERYSVNDGMLWPAVLHAQSEKGEIEIDLKNVELNGELAPNAFVPPRRAQRIE